LEDFCFHIYFGQDKLYDRRTYEGHPQQRKVGGQRIESERIDLRIEAERLDLVEVADPVAVGVCQHWRGSGQQFLLVGQAVAIRVPGRICSSRGKHGIGGSSSAVASTSTAAGSEQYGTRQQQ